MKKILIVSCSVGNGHTKAAQALQKTFNLFYPNIHIEHVDFLNFIGFASKKIFFESYDLMIKNIPSLYRVLFNITDNKTIPKILESAMVLQKKLNTSKLKNFILDHNPDFVIFTHFTPANVFRAMNLQIPHATVVTDYVAHALWQNGNEQKYFVACEETKKSLKYLGIEEKNIIISGIPVTPELYKKYDKKIIQKKLGFAPDKKIMVIMPCWSGKIDTRKIVEKILKNNGWQIAVLVGKDKKIFSKYQTLKNSNLKVVGWTEDIANYLQSADIIISKPGGLTATECITLGKPMILINPIPGQEEENTKYLEKNNFGIQLVDEEKIWDAIAKTEMLCKAIPKTFRSFYPAKTIMEEIKNQL